ncbi:hypothetical protein COCSUDRAFT_59951 [Coccomyxa subellipsoidea C-169]|uniref:ARM repeat-containing protein n=1 Tax=Coccomyxa subellipsoidea (strain C-169) TaxID=574566 RepID=I0YJS3_COCSC|nr:hypothetical protein COCSUDRAFT_59951 [Coccomyxa subellipsoidea C-169]EIE18642.1 hypothetical protein COCSUDRAFT_59951 [Coccomyxa subellipsoidea C-169]|eukprot:XP_005643186.1 hypothetical protein COCSUDRAFT_59951 [Coccomyxa subellipsoidea C-169]
MADGNIDDEAHSCLPPEGSAGETPSAVLSWAPTSESQESIGALHRVYNDFEKICSGFWAANMIRTVDNGDMRCPENTMRVFARSHVTHCVGRITEAIVLDKGRPDVAAAVMMQLLEDGDADVAANMASAPVKRGKPAASFRVFDLMMREGESAAAADVLFHIVREGDAPVVADLLTALVMLGELKHARDVAALLIARGRHGAELAEALGWMIRVGEAAAVAEIVAAVVKAGGLVLACDPPVAAVVLGGAAPGQSPVLELIRMGHVDVVAKICGEVICQKRLDLVCGCFEALADSGRPDAVTEVVQILAMLHRPAVIAQIVAELVGRQRLDLAASCLAALLHGELLWAAAATEDHMAAARVELELSRRGLEAQMVHTSMLLIRGGKVEEWAAIAGELLRMGETAAVAERVAALMDVIGPYLTSSAVAFLAHRTSARAVAQLLLELWASGRNHAASELLAAVANRSPKIARNAVILMGQAPSVAAILVRLAGTGHTDAVVRINRAVRAIGRSTNRHSMTTV